MEAPTNLQRKDEKPSALQKMAALQKKKAELGKKAAGESKEESKTTENPIRGVRVVQAKPAASPAKNGVIGDGRRRRDDEGPRTRRRGPVGARA